MYSQEKVQVSILFQNQHSHDLAHAILYEDEDAFLQLMTGNFVASREGADIFLKITTETELQHIRQITRIPLFIKL
jgi:hypothetical protein